MGKLLSVSEKTGFLYYITIWKKCPGGNGGRAEIKRSVGAPRFFGKVWLY
jgi:hypothetical protein